MRIAAISDIHGNLAALEAVLADIARRGADQIVNLGDIVSGPLWPAETADRLAPLGLPTIRGNHERQVLTGDPATMGLSDRHAASCLRADHRAWLGALPATLALSNEVLLVHGTPASDLAYFLETVEPTGVRAATLAEADARAGAPTHPVVVCGHTHVPRVVRLSDGRLVVNPGSVGLPAYTDEHPHPHAIETGSPDARYALLERSAAGWTAELRAVAYDWDAAARLADERDRPDWARALRTGRT